MNIFISLFMLLSSLCINFGTVDGFYFPLNQELTSTQFTMYNEAIEELGYNLGEVEYVLPLRGNNTGEVFIYYFIPNENYENNLFPNYTLTFDYLAVYTSYTNGTYFGDSYHLPGHYSNSPDTEATFNALLLPKMNDILQGEHTYTIDKSFNYTLPNNTGLGYYCFEFPSLGIDYLGYDCIRFTMGSDTPLDLSNNSVTVISRGTAFYDSANSNNYRPLFYSAHNLDCIQSGKNPLLQGTLCDKDNNFEPEFQQPEELPQSGKQDKPVNENILEEPENDNFLQNALNYISNQINALYNMISTGINGVFSWLGEIKNTILYLFELPTWAEIWSVLQTCNIYILFDELYDTISGLISDLSSVGQQSDFVLTFNLPQQWGGNMSFSFSDYIDNQTLSFIRGLIGAILIITTVIFLFHQIPDIIKGDSGGEN